ncbi:glutamate-1-semialdehyde 2,1-aminomutase-like [Branchiostoma floridae]|uniref:Glutamate-1-semialdehyde 2,1-aminomutase-like n=1 Tax=Branchiostoma floridae TaxID=7739 RepID=A0A9J7LRG6_BRAFL|nr:glutamate-1-semialdehyde 2,1-aminomutase-like [Branchiostoma floridae]
MDPETNGSTLGQAAQRSLDVFPAGSNGEFNLPKDLTTVLSRGKDCYVWDVDGKWYLDFSMGWGTNLVGHAREEVVAAVTEQAAHGSNFAYVNEKSLQLAEEIKRMSPAVEYLRFCSSGTEAIMYCERLARAFTCRSKVLKFEGAYHGANEIGVTSLFPKGLLDYPTPDPSSAGIEHSVKHHVLVAPYNDLSMTTEIVEQHRGDLAAVIVEPLHRCTPPMDGFLQGLRDLTKKHDVLLIFDEVVTGFRLAYGGAQEYYGVIPDLVGYGKALGGGYPIGVFGGRADIMSLVNEDLLGKDERYVWTASSLGCNTISASAALAALQIYRRTGTYQQLHHIGRYVRNKMKECLEKNDISGHVIGDGPLAQVLFTEKLVYNYREQKLQENTARRRAMMVGLFKRGVFLNPMGTKLYLSLKHTEEVCDQFVEIFDQTLQEIKENEKITTRS